MEPMQSTKSVQEWTEQIRRDVADHRIMVYAKGEKNAAVCGFSHRVMQILNALGAEYEVRNIFEDGNLRPALCAYSDWPTTPQIFIDGKFVGGCDILTELYQSGELQRMIEAKPAAGA